MDNGAEGPLAVLLICVLATDEAKEVEKKLIS